MAVWEEPPALPGQEAGGRGEETGKAVLCVLLRCLNLIPKAPGKLSKLLSKEAMLPHLAVHVIHCRRGRG